MKSLFAKVLLVLVLILVGTLFSGCGGSGQTASRAGSVLFTVKWPASRLIPYDSGSIVAVVTDTKNNVLGTQTIPRPAEGVTSTSVTFNNLAVENVTVTATAYPSGNGTGIPQAVGSAPVTVVASQTTPVTVTMADTIVKIQISDNGVVYSGTSISIPVAVGASTNLVETTYNAQNEVVLTSPHTIQWSAVNAFATVSSSGSLTGVKAGSDSVTVVETESGVTALADVTVSSAQVNKFPGAILLNPAGTHLYAILQGGIDVFDIGTTGQLTLIQEISADFINPDYSPFEYFPAVISPNGKYLYAYGADYSHDHTAINEYSIQPDGTLASITAIASIEYMTTLACDPTSSYLYVTGGTFGMSSQVDAYSISATGALSPITIANVFPYTPYGLDSVNGTNFLFSDSYNTGSGFYAVTVTANSNGSLTEVNQLAYPEGTTYPYRAQPPHVYTPSGNEVFTFDGAAIEPFTISPTGVIAQGTPSMLAGGGAGLQGVCSPNGQYLWIRGYGGDSQIHPYSISNDLITALPVTGGTLPTESVGSIVVTPNGTFVYTSNMIDDSIYEYSTNSNGSLTPLSPPKVTG